MVLVLNAYPCVVFVQKCHLWPNEPEWKPNHWQNRLFGLCENTVRNIQIQELLIFLIEVCRVTDVLWGLGFLKTWVIKVLRELLFRYTLWYRSSKIIKKANYFMTKHPLHFVLHGGPLHRTRNKHNSFQILLLLFTQTLINDVSCNSSSHWECHYVKSSL